MRIRVVTETKTGQKILARNLECSSVLQYKVGIITGGRVAKPFGFFLLTNGHGWMIPLQYVKTE
jgi:hypothetical protein